MAGDERYQPALDGLRAFAVCAVIVYHAGMPGMAGGWLGVDVFFVLSGYLITSLLLAEHRRTGGISLPRFWMRRFLRLVPALWLMLAVVVGYAVFIASADARHELLREVAYAGTYTTNWEFLHSHGRQDLGLGHTWSLAVEEQFYLTWPLFVWLAIRLGRIRELGIGVALVVGGIWFMRAGGMAGPYLVFQQRPDALLLGCLLAIVFSRISWRGGHAWALVGIGGLVLLATVGSGLADNARIGYTMVALFAAMALIGLVGARSAPMTRFLSLGLFVVIGRVSYGLYLWHRPFIKWIEIHKPPPVVAVALLALMVGIVAFSYRFVEMRFLRLKDRFRTTHRAEVAVAQPALAAVDEV